MEDIPAASGAPTGPIGSSDPVDVVTPASAETSGAQPHDHAAALAERPLMFGSTGIAGLARQLTVEESAPGAPSADDVRASVQGTVRDLAERDPEALGVAIRQAFGAKADPEAVESLVRQAAAGDLPFPGEVRFVDREDLGGANAAYAPDGDGTIFIASDLADDPPALLGAALEETGHHLDRVLGGGDSLGDEGEIFQRAVQGGALGLGELIRRKLERDEGVVRVDGRDVAVEFQRPGAVFRTRVASQLDELVAAIDFDGRGRPTNLAQIGFHGQWQRTLGSAGFYQSIGGMSRAEVRREVAAAITRAGGSSSAVDAVMKELDERMVGRLAQRTLAQTATMLGEAASQFDAMASDPVEISRLQRTYEGLRAAGTRDGDRFADQLLQGLGLEDGDMGDAGKIAAGLRDRAGLMRGEVDNIRTSASQSGLALAAIGRLPGARQQVLLQYGAREGSYLDQQMRAAIQEGQDIESRTTWMKIGAGLLVAGMTSILTGGAAAPLWLSAGTALTGVAVGGGIDVAIAYDAADSAAAHHSAGAGGLAQAQAAEDGVTLAWVNLGLGIALAGANSAFLKAPPSVVGDATKEAFHAIAQNGLEQAGAEIVKRAGAAILSSLDERILLVRDQGLSAVDMAPLYNLQAGRAALSEEDAAGLVDVLAARWDLAPEAYEPIITAYLTERGASANVWDFDDFVDQRVGASLDGLRKGLEGPAGEARREALGRALARVEQSYADLAASPEFTDDTKAMLLDAFLAAHGRDIASMDARGIEVSYGMFLRSYLSETPPEIAYDDGSDFTIDREAAGIVEYGDMVLARRSDGRYVQTNPPTQQLFYGYDGEYYPYWGADVIEKDGRFYQIGNAGQLRAIPNDDRHVRDDPDFGRVARREKIVRGGRTYLVFEDVNGNTLLSYRGQLYRQVGEGRYRSYDNQSLFELDRRGRFRQVEEPRVPNLGARHGAQPE